MYDNKPRLKFNMQYPSKSDCINYIKKNYCEWGLKMSKYDVNPRIKGSSTPLWRNDHKIFFKGFYISNCISSLVFIIFFVVLEIAIVGNQNIVGKLNEIIYTDVKFNLPETQKIMHSLIMTYSNVTNMTNWSNTTLKELKIQAKYSSCDNILGEFNITKTGKQVIAIEINIAANKTATTRLLQKMWLGPILCWPN